VGALQKSLLAGGLSEFHGAHITTLWNSGKRTLWWFTESGHPAFPAVVCTRQIVRASGFQRMPVQSDCGHASKRACASLAKDLVKAKF
jgi:hypothetical protein